MLRPGSASQLALEDLICLPTNDRRRQKEGCLMSGGVYCHWVGCGVPRGTAAFPIRQLRLNGQQTHNGAEKWMHR
ncbi:hypothetical protein VZT92_023981 [Zoarces viviparus]|uniref:Uncharacterized protein n=1 Tax=Zoarces viviparus TaxID=48416 RepID=A0AAW1E496_ZOAVI